MPNYIRIDNFDAPELDVYVRLTGAQLRSKIEPSLGVFIAESPTPLCPCDHSFLQQGF